MFHTLLSCVSGCEKYPKANYGIETANLCKLSQKCVKQICHQLQIKSSYPKEPFLSSFHLYPVQNISAIGNFAWINGYMSQCIAFVSLARSVACINMFLCVMFSSVVLKETLLENITTEKRQHIFVLQFVLSSFLLQLVHISMRRVLRMETSW